MKSTPSLLLSLVCLVLPAGAIAQNGELGSRLLADPAVRAALDVARQNERRTLEEQVRLSEIPAPPFAEQRRAEAYRQRFEELGLRNVRVDAVGNVLGERPGRSPRPHLVFSAHLDTVFPEETDVSVERDGALLRGPGIADDARGLAVLLAVVQALDEAGVETQGSITFVGTVGEEGLGDLRGVKHLFDTTPRGGIDRFVSLDGAGYEITHVGVGSHRYRVTFEGAGGHSYSAFGLANPIHALGRAIARIAELETPADPKTTFSVGRIGGGTSVNSIAFEAWMEVDLRSHDVEALAAVDADFSAAVEAALAAENERWDGVGRLRVDVKRVGTRPAGSTPADGPIVEAAISVTRALGLPVELGVGSTDSNLAMNLGIPAITVDAGGSASGTHALDEVFDSTDSWKGTQRALLLAIALTEPLGDAP